MLPIVVSLLHPKLNVHHWQLVFASMDEHVQAAAQPDGAGRVDPVPRERDSSHDESPRSDEGSPVAHRRPASSLTLRALWEGGGLTRYAPIVEGLLAEATGARRGSMSTAAARRKRQKGASPPRDSLFRRRGSLKVAALPTAESAAWHADD